MPTINTGNPGWDENLSKLGNALFPDPSKAAHAYYYGAEARKAQAETNKITNQQNYGFRFMQMQPDSAQPLAPPTYSPGELPGFAPIINAPSNLPMASGPGRPPLSSVMTGPTGGQLVPQTMTPEQAAAATPDQFNNHPGNQGTPPPVSPPTPGASPAPNTTGSDGSVPGNDPTARGFHPGSVLERGGGTKWGPPADHNGSAARTPVSLATYVATAVQSGMDAAQASLQGQAYLAALYKQGSIDAHTLHELLAGTGQAAPLVADIGAVSAGNVANIQAASHIAAQNIVTNENARQFNKTPKLVGDAASGVPPVYANQIDVAGKTAFEPQVANTIAAAQNAYGNYFNPNTGKYEYTTAKDANARGLVEGAKSGDSQQQQMLQRYMAMPPGPDKDRMLMDMQAAAATPAVVDPKVQERQQIVNYNKNQEIYAVPQTSIYGTVKIKSPVVFDNVTSDVINSRQTELRRQPENRMLNPLELHEKAIISLQTQPLPDGKRLPTPAEVVAMRAAWRAHITSLGTKGDPRLATVTPPGAKQPTDHMIIKLMTPEEIAAATGTPIKASSIAPAPTTPAPAPTTSAPTTVSNIPTNLGSVISSIFQGRSIGGVGLPGRSLWGAPAPAASAPAPAAPAPTPAVSGGAPPGALGPAPRGATEGQVIYKAGGVPAGVNRGGWVMPN